MSDTGSSSTSTAIIKVSPEVLVEKAAVVKEKISNMQTAFTNMMNVVSKSKSYWIGDASEAHRKVYKSYETEVTEIFNRFSEHVVDLTKMAGVYEKVEKEVAEVAENLPTDLIS
ncbi:WXG100 family type VII secretion target [Anaerosporobacter faecicola]|uniref:WXG100 family type VII secretion target n=1 Tax=Anaerosporobacter faecicola TaxID=2718714 RepID=UPI00143B391E|nr:WXG100 family type VII secretion target [Anaerosporobacter faecicola]